MPDAFYLKKIVWDTGKMRNAGVRDTGETGIAAVPDTGKLIFDNYIFFQNLMPSLQHVKQQSIKKQSKSSINYTNTFESCFKKLSNFKIHDRFTGFQDNRKPYKKSNTVKLNILRPSSIGPRGTFWRTKTVKKILCNSSFKGGLTGLINLSLKGQGHEIIIG